MVSSVSFDAVTGLPKSKDADPKKALESFEQIFVARLVRDMREAYTKDLKESGGLDNDMYMMWFDQAVAEAMVQKGGIGLTAQLEEYVQASRQASSPDDPG